MLMEQGSGDYNNVYKYNGKELDEAKGLYYYGARYYDPNKSVWLSVDPLAIYHPVMETEFYGDGQHNGGVFNVGNLNAYIYCYQNPIIYVDPNGKQADFNKVLNDGINWFSDLDNIRSSRRWWSRNMDQTGNTETMMRFTPGISNLMMAGDIMDGGYMGAVDAYMELRMANLSGRSSGLSK